MKEKANYTTKTFGRFSITNDVLPSPENLIAREDTVKVTISLSKTSVEFFKREAKQHNTQYQKMIRRLLDLYAQHYGHDRRLES